MDTSQVYNSLEWELARGRALARDGHRCTVARLLGGDCSRGLDVHHIRPLTAGGAPYDLSNLGTVCDSHHPMWEGLRRSILRTQDGPPELTPRCNHRHPTAEARELCEARMARTRRVSVAA